MKERMTVQDVRDYYENLDLAGIAYSDLDFKIKYADFAMEFFEEALPQRGYKKPTASVVRNRFRELFGVELDAPNEELYVRGLGRYVSDKNDVDGRNKQAVFMDPNGKTSFFESILYDEKGGFFVRNPDLYGLVLVNGSSADSVDYRFAHPDVTYALFRNNYVFHNSRSALVWMLVNDKSFLMDLCRLYDYDIVPEINDLVIADALDMWTDYSNGNREIMAYDNLFCRHSGDGELKIHEGLLAYLCDSLKMDFDLSWYNLFNCYRVDVLFSLRGSLPEHLSKFSLEERMKVAAYLGYYSRKGLSDAFPLFSSELNDNPAFVDYLVSNDYFGLVGFQEMIADMCVEAAEAKALQQLRMENRYPE
ncbi:MAG: hypothetical protein J5554_02520 [Paludibacteraceae bacterium]|nr:hypothetical protein [Paludibacteraceae bacterium]